LTPSNTYECININTYTDIYPMIIVACVLTVTHVAKDCFEDVRWFIFINVTLCVITRVITGICTTCGDITTTKSACKPKSGCDAAGSVCTIINHIYLSRADGRTLSATTFALTAKRGGAG